MGIEINKIMWYSKYGKRGNQGGRPMNPDREYRCPLCGWTVRAPEKGFAESLHKLAADNPDKNHGTNAPEKNVLGCTSTSMEELRQVLP